MANVPVQVRVDEETKKQASILLEGLGLNLTDAINMFLKQVVLRRGIPFDISYPEDISNMNLEEINSIQDKK